MLKNPTDRRYRTYRWRTTSKRVRASGPCYVPTCTAKVHAADHVVPVYPGMPDWQFYDETNLRPSCRHHNVARGVAARLERETAGLPAPAPLRRTSYGRSPGYVAVEMGYKPSVPPMPRGRHIVRYHACNGDLIYGDMSIMPRWTDASRCPPECPRGATR